MSPLLSQNILHSLTIKTKIMAKKDIKKDLKHIHVGFDGLGAFFYIANPATERKAKQHKLFDFIGDEDPLDVVHVNAERGWAVATNNHSIVAQKQDGIEQTINYHKNGTTNKHNYPAWYTVTPSAFGAEEKSVLKFRPQKMLNVVSAFTDVWSNLGTARYKKNISPFIEFQHSGEYVPNGVETITFNATSFKKFLEMMVTHEIDTVVIPKGERTWIGVETDTLEMRFQACFNPSSSRFPGFGDRAIIEDYIATDNIPKLAVLLDDTGAINFNAAFIPIIYCDDERLQSFVGAETEEPTESNLPDFLK